MNIPYILNPVLNKNGSINKLIYPTISKNKFIKKQNAPIYNLVPSCIKELFFIRYPKYRKNKFPKKKFVWFASKIKIVNNYIYLPWRKEVFIVPQKTIFNEILTARNVGLISSSEQQRYRKFSIGIAGLSIGSAAAHFLVRSGGPERYKLADFDKIELSNLNRMNAGYTDCGRNKAIVAAQKIWEINPYAKIQIWNKGVSKDNIIKFILHEYKLDFIIDAIDDLPLKVIIRKECQKLRVPVIMATSNGDSIIIDIERYDIEPNYKIFHGKISNNPSDYEFKTYKEWLSLSNKIVDKSLLTPAMLNIMPKIGITLSGVPQLATTVNYGGLIISSIIRDIAKLSHVPSGRYIYYIGNYHNR